MQLMNKVTSEYLSKRLRSSLYIDHTMSPLHGRTLIAKHAETLKHIYVSRAWCPPPKRTLRSSAEGETAADKEESEDNDDEDRLENLVPVIEGNYMHWIKPNPRALMPYVKLPKLQHIFLGPDWTVNLGTVRFNRDGHRNVLSYSSSVAWAEELYSLTKGLPHLHRLSHLSLRDMPDLESYMSHVYRIGRAFRDLPALESLDLELTSPVQPSYWDEDERFERRPDLDHFFNLIFRPTEFGGITHQDRAHDMAYRTKDDHDDVHSNGLEYTPSLSLKKLRLKHIDIPERAWTHVFKPEVIEELCIPYSITAPSTWITFHRVGTQLRNLGDVDFESLSPELLTFIRSLDHLETLSFATPVSNYIARPFLNASNEVEYWTMVRSVPNPASRGGTIRKGAEHLLFTDAGEAIYPHLQNADMAFLLSMMNKPHLRHLTLPAEMFVIGPTFLQNLATSLPSLQELDIGFDFALKENREAFASMTRMLRALRKVTLRSLSRPYPLSQYDTKSIESRLRSSLFLHSVGPRLKYLRLLGWSLEAHAVSMLIIVSKNVILILIRSRDSTTATGSITREMTCLRSRG